MGASRLASLLLRSAAIVAAGSALGLALNAAGPHRVPLGTPVYAAAASGTAACGAGEAEGAPSAQIHARISVADAVGACNACSAGFVDARGADAFAHGHISGAVHLPPQGHPDEAAALAELRHFRTIVVYDDAGGCRLARPVADRLRAQGFADVRLLDMTFTDWTATGGPAESGACKACQHGAETHR